MDHTASLVNFQIKYEITPCKELHWHDHLEIIFQLSGKSKISLRGQQYMMHEDDILVINPFELHNAELLGFSSYLSFCIPRAILLQGKPLQFSCFSFLCSSRQHAELNAIRQELAEIFQLYLEESDAENLKLLSHLYELIHLLKTHFSTEAAVLPTLDQPRLSGIITYLNEHYTEEITLQALAKQEFLSPNYLSQLFRDKLHTTFTDCLGDIRLSHAFFDLCNTEKSITEIALENGFSRVDTFIDRFRKKYDVTPGKFRKGLPSFMTDIPHRIPSQDTAADDITLGRRFHSLLKYRAPHNAISQEDDKPMNRSVRFSALHKGATLQHDWKTIINAGYADDCFTVEVQNQLAHLQKMVGFRYVRFHGIFSDSMHIYEEDASGTPLFHFTYVDMLLDRLLSLGFQLFIEFSFLPQALSSMPDGVYQNHSHICFPNSLDNWKLLVQRFLQHCISRYGIHIVRQWKFSLFSISFSLYGFLSAEAYYQLYHATYSVVKSLDPSFAFCGPGIEGSQLMHGQDDTCLMFLQNCLRDNCVPDCITFHSFPHSFDEINTNFNQMVHHNNLSMTFSLSKNENFMSDVISNMKHMLTSLHLDHIPMLIDEWNSTIWQRDLCSDTCYKAVHIIKNTVENMDRTIGKAYWTVSDLINDWKIDGKLFHGGHGLFTYNGIPKSSVYAFQMLSRLGDTFLASGEGWYATRSVDEIQIILYHYCHYNTMYRMLSEFHDPEERYSAFQQKSPISFHIHIDGVSAGNYICEYHRIGRNGGSPLDEYIRMGSPADLSDDNLSYLAHRSEPIRYIEQRQSLTDITLTLQPLETALLLIRF